jgi:hypothetical protein
MSTPAYKLFLPFSEDLLDRIGVPIGDLVPFQLEYQCAHLLGDGKDIKQVEDAKDADKTAIS